MPLTDIIFDVDELGALAASARMPAIGSNVISGTGAGGSGIPLLLTTDPADVPAGNIQYPMEIDADAAPIVQPVIVIQSFLNVETLVGGVLYEKLYCTYTINGFPVANQLVNTGIQSNVGALFTFVNMPGTTAATITNPCRTGAQWAAGVPAGTPCGPANGVPICASTSGLDPLAYYLFTVNGTWDQGTDAKNYTPALTLFSPWPGP